jgi:replication fork clamp-binding protein CrfC
MHASNIEAAKRETLRLLAYIDKVLGEHLTTEDLVREADPEQLRRLDREKAELWKRAIRNEIHKVEDLETVLAVIGTVKAGIVLPIVVHTL